MALSEEQGLPLGMMAFWASIATVSQVAYSRWHNAEHIPERLAIAGFQRGARYRLVKDENRFLMFYETTGPEVLKSADYVQALNNPTARTKQALTWFDKPVRNVYRLLATTGSVQTVVAPILATLQFDSHKSLDQGILINDLAEYGAQRVAVYEVEATGSSVRTNESSLHGASNAKAGGLIRIECDDLRLLDDHNAWNLFESKLAVWCRRYGLEGMKDFEIGTIDFCRDRNPKEKL